MCNETLGKKRNNRFLRKVLRDLKTATRSGTLVPPPFSPSRHRKSSHFIWFLIRAPCWWAPSIFPVYLRISWFSLSRKRMIRSWGPSTVLSSSGFDYILSKVSPTLLADLVRARSLTLFYPVVFSHCQVDISYRQMVAPIVNVWREISREWRLIFALTGERVWMRSGEKCDPATPNRPRSCAGCVCASVRKLYDEDHILFTTGKVVVPVSQVLFWEKGPILGTFPHFWTRYELYVRPKFARANELMVARKSNKSQNFS